MKKVTRERETVSFFSQPAAVADTPPVVPGPQRPFQAALPADPDSVILLVDQIEVREQVRQDFDEQSLRELAADIETHGQLQPIVVSPLNGSRFLLDAGERRLRAIRDVLGRDQIRATIRRVAGNEEACTRMLVQIAENDKREDLTKIEVAQAIVRLQKETGWSDAEVGARMHRSRTWVVQVRAVLNAPPSVQRAISAGAVSWHSWTHEPDALKTLASHLPADVDPEAFAKAYESARPVLSDGGGVGAKRKKTSAAKGDDNAKDPSISMSLTDARALLRTLQKVAAKHKIKCDDVPKDLNRKELAEVLVAIQRKIGRAL